MYVEQKISPYTNNPRSTTVMQYGIDLNYENLTGVEAEELDDGSDSGDPHR